MKFYKILINLFTFERIKKIMFFLFFVKVVGVPSFFFLFYCFFVNRKTIIDGLIVAAAGGEDKLQDAYNLLYLLSISWVMCTCIIDAHILFTYFSPPLIINELCEYQVIRIDTTIEEAVELVRNRQLEMVESYGYPLNKLYEFEIKNSSLIDEWERLLHEHVEKLNEK